MTHRFDLKYVIFIINKFWQSFFIFSNMQKLEIKIAKELKTSKYRL